MPNLVQDLNGLDFSIYIGGPLQAAIHAQKEAAIAQVDFINSIGFDESTPKKLRYVDFGFTKSVPNPNLGKTPAQLLAEGLPANTDVTTASFSSDVNIQVPFLSIVHVPCLMIEEVCIDFNAKLSSVETTNASKAFSAGLDLGLNFKKINLKASVSYKSSSSNGSKVEKSYSLSVQVKARNCDLPGGLVRVFDMLESSIVANAN
jgi:hypothetical protein